MNKKFTGKVCCFLLFAMLSGSYAFGASPSAFAEHYNAAQDYLMQNQYTSAIIEFRKALKINFLDNSARIGVINSYLARANFYANQEKNYEKAANDFRSALFYLKIYPQSEQDVQNSIGMISSASSNLNQCLKVTGFDTTASNRYKRAEELRAVANFSAAGYEFSKASENEKYAADANIQIADMMKLLGNEPRSVDFYKKALDIKPNDGLLRMKYARTLDRVGNYDAAVNEYNQALANSKGNMEVLYALERIYLKKLAQTPSDAELNANIGAIKQAQGDFDSALSYYSKAEQLNPNSVTTRINVGTLYQQKKEYNKAIKAYDSVLIMYPNNDQALFYKAQALSEMGDKKTALGLYKQVLVINPQNNDARNAIGEIIKETMSPAEYIAYLTQNGTASELYDYGYSLHKDNKTGDAISAYKAAIQKDSSKVDAYVNLAICYASKDDYNNAISVLNNAKNMFPSNNLVLKTLKDVQKDSTSAKMASASSSYDNKDYKRAIQEYLSVNPATEDSMLGVAASYQALEDYNNAITYYKKAESINPKNSEIPYYIGYLYSEQQNWTEAEKYLRKSVSINPNSDAKPLLTYVTQNGTLAVLNDGISLYEKKNYTEALQKFNDVIKKDTKNAFAHYYRGLIYDEQKQHKLAITDYIDVVNNSKDFPIANYMIAVDYDTLENYKEAFKYFKQFVANYTTDDEYFKYAKSRMEELKPYAG
ncbi:tetratricopeptide repeat protein [bacterium]|nr:tetratricopeptide repeat protein [bacterium]